MSDGHRSRRGAPTPAVGDGIVLESRESGCGALCRTLLESLPDWFGIPETVEDLVAKAECAPALVATLDGCELGLLLLLRHNARAAEIELIAVSPQHHRRGIGRALIQRAEAQLRTAGVEYLQVKTLAETVEYEPYERTRAFYISCGFTPLQVFPDLWDAENPALQLVKRL